MADPLARCLKAEVDAKRMMAGMSAQRRLSGAWACRNEKRAERPVFADILAESGGYSRPVTQAIDSK
ncbi:hypothetical protein [Burkholderia cepacia]|uniref:hypothetical protein n=1 Tax=Burkholderia cepacia TaxID=292 RepID=UPI002FE12537